MKKRCTELVDLKYEPLSRCIEVMSEFQKEHPGATLVLVQDDYESEIFYTAFEYQREETAEERKEREDLEKQSKALRLERYENLKKEFEKGD